MRRYDSGDTATLRHEVRNAAGELTAATVSLVLTLPDGTTDTVTTTAASTGVYVGTTDALDLYGLYGYVWTVSGTVTDVDRGQLYVADDDDRLPPLASLDRLGRKLGYTPVDAEADRAADILDAASELIRDTAGKTWVVEDTGALENVPRRVASICVEVAYRAFANPEALSQRSIGDSSKSYDRAKREGGEAVYLTKAEEEAIRKAAGSTGSSLTSVTLVSPYSGSYLDDEGELIWA
jgi:hypothetical protein